MLAIRVQWTRASDPSSTIIIQDAITLNITKSTEIKNNIASITLKNAISKFLTTPTLSTSSRIGEYIDETTGRIKFDQDDEIRIWTAYLTDADDVANFLAGGSSWYDDDNLLGAFTIKEHNLQNTPDNSRIQIKAVDIAYILFNKIQTYTYGVTTKFTSPGIIRHLARTFGEAEDSDIDSQSGTHNDSGTPYIVKAKFVSEGGYIKDYRDETGSPSTTLDGALNDSDTTINVVSTSGFEATDGTIVIDTEHISYTGVTGTSFTGCTRGIDDTVKAAHDSATDVYQGFPLILVSKSWSPVFEWIGEMSQTQNLNFNSEIEEGGSAFYDRAFMFWVDKNNEAHWFYPDDIVDLTIDLGEEGRTGFRLDKSVFDAVNLIIYNCGDDMYGNGITYYLFDETTEVTTMKMRYQPMTKIVHQLITTDRGVNTDRDTSGTQDELKQFPLSYDPAIVPSFLDEANKFRRLIGLSDRTNVESDSAYNDCLREAAKWRGREQALKITTLRSGLRYKGQISLKGTHLNPGDLVQVTNGWLGLNSQLLRVINVTHAISANNWMTTLEVQEDEKVIS